MNELKVIGKQQVGKFSFTGIEGGFGNGKKAMTVKDISEIHEQPQGEINRRINDNIHRFKLGVDIIDLKSVMGLNHNDFGFTQNAWNRLNNAYILSERGYAKLLKILEDDTAWEIYDELVDNYFSMRESIKIEQPNDLFIKRMNAEARLKNANARQAKLLAELAKDALSEVNKAILQDKAVQSLTGEKLLEMPATGKHFNDCEEIAKKIGVYSENGNPHGTAISQLIKQELILKEDEQEVFPEYKGGWSGTVTKYADCVIDKVKEWLSDNGYPTILKLNKNYKVVYK